MRHVKLPPLLPLFSALVAAGATAAAFGLSRSSDRNSFTRADSSKLARWDPPDAPVYLRSDPARENATAQNFAMGLTELSPDQRNALIAELEKQGDRSALEALLRLYAVWTADGGTFAARQRILEVFSRLPDVDLRQQMILDAVASELETQQGFQLLGYAAGHLELAWRDAPNLLARGRALLPVSQNPRIQLTLLLAVSSSREPGPITATDAAADLENTFAFSKDRWVRVNALSNLANFASAERVFALALNAVSASDRDDLTWAAAGAVTRVGERLPEHREQAAQMLVDLAMDPAIAFDGFRGVVKGIATLVPARLADLLTQGPRRDAQFTELIERAIAETKNSGVSK